LANSEKIIIIRCPADCGAFLEEKEQGFWKCPVCGGEWWPELDDTPEKLAKAARKAMDEDVRVGFFGFGGKHSSGSKSKRHKKKPKRNVSAERYKLE
jgi:hypothetical protein